MAVKLVAGLCRLSLAFDAACNGSPNVRRGNSGQQVTFAGLRQPVMIRPHSCTTGFSLFECLLDRRIRQMRSRGRDNFFLLLTLCTPTLNLQVGGLCCFAHLLSSVSSVCAFCRTVFYRDGCQGTLVATEPTGKFSTPFKT